MACRGIECGREPSLNRCGEGGDASKRIAIFRWQPMHTLVARRHHGDRTSVVTNGGEQEGERSEVWGPKPQVPFRQRLEEALLLGKRCISEKCGHLRNVACGLSGLVEALSL